VKTITENKVRHATMWVIGAAVVGLIGWDVYAESKGEEDTISDILHDAGKKCMAIPFAFGCLMGHFFLGVNDRR
jgi:uncharacterized membrane protein YhdT